MVSADPDASTFLYSRFHESVMTASLWLPSNRAGDLDFFCKQDEKKGGAHGDAWPSSCAEMLKQVQQTDPQACQPWVYIKTRTAQRVSDVSGVGSPSMRVASATQAQDNLEVWAQDLCVRYDRTAGTGKACLVGLCSDV